MRAKYRKPKKRRSGSMGWNVAIAAVVVIGVIAVILTRSGGDSAGDVAPFVATSENAGSHWHTALGVNICGEWIPDIPTFETASGTSSVRAGIHTHSDGLIHTHPYVTSEAGNNATLGKFADYAGFNVSDSSIDAWTGPEDAPDRSDWSNGDTCSFGEFEGQEGKVVWAVDGKARTGNPADYKMKDGETLAIGFVPTSANLGFPPRSCEAFANISDQQEALLSENSPCRTTASTTTTVPPSTETTAAPAAP